MLEAIGSCLASFTRPIEIGTTPGSLLWLFPLLVSIAVVYKATRMRVLKARRFFLECAVLVLTLSAFMAASIVVLNLLVWLITS